MGINQFILERTKVSGTSRFFIFGNLARIPGVGKWSLRRKRMILTPDRIVSRRDLVDGSKDSKNYPGFFGKNIFFIFRPKKFENGKKQSKNDQK